MSSNPMIDKAKKNIDDVVIDDNIKTNSNSAGAEFVNRTIKEKVRDLKPDDVVRAGRKNEERSMIAIKLKKDIADKVKAYAFNKNLTVTEVVEDVVNALFKDEKLDKKALKQYNDKYKKKRTNSSSEEE